MEQYLTIDELSKLIHLKKSTIYKYVCGRRIPHIKTSEKHLLFKKTDIEDWLESKQVDEVCGS